MAAYRRFMTHITCRLIAKNGSAPEPYARQSSVGYLCLLVFGTLGRSEDTEFVGNNLQQHFGQFCARQLGVGRPSRAAFAGAQFYRFRSHKFVDRGLQAFESVAGDVVDQLTDYPAVARRFIQHHVIAGRPRDTLTRRRRHFAISSSSSSCSFNRKLSNATHTK